MMVNNILAIKGIKHLLYLLFDAISVYYNSDQRFGFYVFKKQYSLCT